MSKVMKVMNNISIYFNKIGVFRQWPYMALNIVSREKDKVVLSQ